MSAIKLDATIEGGQDRPLRVAPAHRSEARELLEFFRSDPVANLFHIGVVDDHGIAGEGRTRFRYWLARSEGELVTAAFVAHTGMASVAGAPDGARALGQLLREEFRLRLVVGERTASDALWGSWGEGEPRLNRSHRLFVHRRTTGLGEPELRLAESGETEEIVALAAAMRMEELGRMVAAHELEEFAGRVAARVEEHRVYVLEREGQVVFKADVGTRCRDGAQIEGVYVLPEKRGRGLASRCVAEMARRLERRWPRVTLHVYEENAPAIRAYERAGFEAAHPFRLILAD